VLLLVLICLPRQEGRDKKEAPVRRRKEGRKEARKEGRKEGRKAEVRDVAMMICLA